MTVLNEYSKMEQIINFCNLLTLMDQWSTNINSSIHINLPLQKHQTEPQSSPPFASTSLSRLKYLTQEISKCCDSLSNTVRKRSSLCQRIQTYEKNLNLKAKKQEQQQLLKKKLVVYKRQLGKIGQERKYNIKELLKSWSQPKEGRSGSSSMRLNLVSGSSKTVHSNISYSKTSSTFSRHNKTQNTQNDSSISNLINNTIKSSHSKILPRKSKFSSNLLFVPQVSNNNRKQNKQNKLLSLFNKAPSRVPFKVITKTHSPQHKSNSFMQRRSNAYSVLIERQRSITRVLRQYNSPKEVFKVQALDQIYKIMKNQNLTLKDKMNRLMEIKVKMNNLQSDESKHGDVGKKVKECILELYNQIINDK